MPYRFNPLTGNLDLVDGYDLYTDTVDGKLWQVSVASGHLVLTDITPATGTAGVPMGLLLTLTYSS